MPSLSTLTLLAITGFLSLLSHRIWLGVYNFFLHPLARYPEPIAAGVTEWYKTWQEVVLSKSWTDILFQLHRKYGDVVRVGPNELHFSSPDAFNDIYNNSNRWDKDGRLYHCFGEDRSSFGFLTYGEAKRRKDVLAPLFSRRTILDLQSVVRMHMERLCTALAADNAANRSSDMLFGLRCFTLDTIVEYCFAQDVNAVAAPDFRAPIVVAMDASLPGFTVFRNFELVRRMVFAMPGWLTKMSTPAIAGLVDLQQLLGDQVKEVARNPDSLAKLPHPIIYHRLLDPGANGTAGVPSPGSLYEEAQALLFGGADSAGNTAMIGMFHLLKDHRKEDKLRAELLKAWPNPAEAPTLE